MVQITKSKLQRLIREEVRDTIAPMLAQRADGPSYMKAIQAPKAVQYDANGKDVEKGIKVAQVFRSLAAGKCDRDNSIQFATTAYGVHSGAVKALSAGDFTAGGATIGEELASEIIDLLRPRSIIRRMGPMMVQPEKGTLTFPKITSGASAGYVEENEDIPSSEQVFGQIMLVAKKLAALVPISNDLLRFSVDADTIIRDDLINVLATAEDQNMLRGNGLLGTPKGLRNQAAAANVTATNGETATNIEDDFKDLINGLTSNDVPMIRPHILMAPRSRNHLFTLRDANGNLIFPEIRAENPTLYSFPVLLSNNIPTNLGGGSNETEVYLVDASEVVFGEVQQIDVAVSTDASYLDSGSTLRSAFSRDQTLMRANSTS